MYTLIAVHLAVLPFALGALAAEIVVFIKCIVHRVRFVLGQLHLAIALLEGGSPGKIHPSIYMHLDRMKVLGAESAVVMVEGDGRALSQLGM